jgi:MFS family permease
VSPGASPLGRRFWRLWSAFLSSNLADGVTFIVLPWLATLVTDSAFWVGAVAAASRLPWLIAVIAGLAVDRRSPARLMAETSCARAVCWIVLVALALTGELGLTVLLLASLVLGVIEVVYETAAQTALPHLVPDDALVRANGHLRTAEITAQEFLGRPAGGLLLAVSSSLALTLNAVASLVSAVLLFTLRHSTPVSRPPEAEAESRWHAATRGARVIVQHPLLSRLAVSTVCFNLVYAAILATQVLFAQQVLGLGAAQFGLLMTATAVGGVLGGTLSGRIAALLPAGWMPMLSLAVVGAGHAAIAAVPHVAVVACALAVSSAAVLTYSVSVVSLRQKVTERRLLGRVNAAMGTVTWGVAAIGMVAGGAGVDLLARWMDRTDALRAVYALSTAVVVVLLVTVGRRVTVLAARVDG